MRRQKITMPKFNVTLGRLVRESATVVVEAKDEKTLERRLHEVYEAYDGDWDQDVEWGCDESNSHIVEGPAKPRAKVQVKLK
jgi:hypothetical protein